MNRSFPPTARAALVTLLVAAVLGTACEPDHNVQPGAPVLTKVTLVTPGPAPVTITADTPECATGIVGREACDPTMDGLCRQTDTSWCSCTIPDPMDMTVGIWDCTPFGVLAVIGVFDRLLDTAPFDAAYPAGITDAITAAPIPTAPSFEVVTDYASSGTPMGATPLLGFFGGNFRDNGPSVVGMPAPGFPSGVAVTVTLDAGTIRAKDGTPFTAGGLLSGGTVGFTMPAFSATIDPPNANHGAPLVIFNNSVPDDKAPDPVFGHITVTSNGADFTAQVDMSLGAAVVTVSPKAGAWPAGATIAITVDAATQNTLGQPIDGPHTQPFTAP